MTSVILDLSRLISRIRYSTPTGVDRVEMAYARGLLRLFGDELAFAAVHPTGLYGRLNRATALAYLDELERRWRTKDAAPVKRSVFEVLPWMARLLPRAVPRGRTGERRVYVQVSPHHLTQMGRMQRILASEQACFLCMVHDLIPIEYPEYARPGGAELHRRRIETVVACADAVVVNSAATERSLQAWIGRSGRDIATHVGLLGTETLPAAAPVTGPDVRPYFVCLGTIEGRKNHLMLLHLWRKMGATLPENAVPRLVVVGRRGWENEQVLDLLDRCPTLTNNVEEIVGCTDTQLASLLRGACATLMPSFAEGFGMPIAESLALGVPVICSDIPAHHEVGGNAPDFVDPLDGQRWHDLIIDYAQHGPARQAQMMRLRDWHEPSWEDHMGIVADAIAQVTTNA